MATRPSGSPGDAWVRLVAAVSDVLEHVDRDEVAPQQARATRALARLLTGRGLTVHLERDGRRVATLGEGRRRTGSVPPLQVASSRPARGARPEPDPRSAGSEGDQGASIVDRTPVVIGAHPACDLVLPGLKPRHAVLGHDIGGRTVLKALAGRCYVDGSPVVSQVVDADSDIRLGEHRLTLGEVVAAEATHGG